MANRHNLLAPDYMIQVKTQSGDAESGTQISYSNIKLMDADSSYFITADEIIRCLYEALCKQSTLPSEELTAEKNMVASADEVRKIASTV